MASDALHEPAEMLRPETIEMHRAIASLIEELEAVDWYAQRVDASRDDALRAVLAHNRDEEKEHACMTLEWIRRRDPAFDRLLREILFRKGPIEAETANGGIVTDSTQKGVALPREPEALPNAVTEALEQLRQAGVSGPYGMALGPEPYAALEAAGGGGYPVLKHVERLLGGPVVWAPSLRGGVVLSRRGDDFRLVCGRDAAIGYLSHDEKVVRLYLEESFSAEVNTPEAAVPLLLPEASRARRR